jgi:hypothetical protein
MMSEIGFGGEIFRATFFRRMRPRLQNLNSTTDAAILPTQRRPQDGPNTSYQEAKAHGTCN